MSDINNYSCLSMFDFFYSDNPIFDTPIAPPNLALVLMKSVPMFLEQSLSIMCQVGYVRYF